VTKLPESAKPADTRSAKRVKIDAFVKVNGPDREFVFRTRDVSKTGLFLYTKVAYLYPFKIGSTLRLELYDHDGSVTCNCVVARVVEPGSAESDHYPTGFGLRILDMPDPDRELFESMLSRAEQGDLY
jgi:hypothetical protein